MHVMIKQSANATTKLLSREPEG